MKEKVSYFYKLLIAIIGVFGLYLNFNFIPISKCIVYFTIISNICCTLFYIILSIKPSLNKNKKYYLFKGLLSMIMIFTMIMFQIMNISGTLEAYVGHELASTFVHIILPVMVIIDYILFDHKGNIKWYYAFVWTIFLVMYGVLIILYSKFGGSFYNGACMPYDFLDWHKIGILPVILNNVIIYSAFIMFGLIIYLIDKKSGERGI